MKTQLIIHALGERASGKTRILSKIRKLLRADGWEIEMEREEEAHRRRLEEETTALWWLIFAFILKGGAS